jgi:hypothetical protein
MLVGFMLIIDIILMCMYMRIAIKSTHDYDKTLYFVCSALWGACVLLNIARLICT